MLFFFFNDTATTEIYTLSLHDALPISTTSVPLSGVTTMPLGKAMSSATWRTEPSRSEEHTSELQSRGQLVCRLLLEKKKAHGRKARRGIRRHPPRRRADSLHSR